MIVKLNIEQVGEFKFLFDFNEDTYRYSEEYFSKQLEIDVKEIARKLKCSKDLNIMEEYREVINQKIKENILNNNEIKIYNYGDIINTHISKTIDILTFFIKQKFKLKTVFKTGEALSIQDGDFCINLMLEKYPTFWNEKYDYSSNKSISNTDYRFYITEISREDNELWKIEIISTKIGERRYYLAGRFKFFVKNEDILRFKYYENENNLYCVNAKITKLDYNEIELTFDKGISKPIEFYDTERSSSYRW